jgi:hypothetical protein
MLGQVQQATGMGDQTSANQLANQNSEIGSDRLHAVLEVVEQGFTVVCDGNHLAAKRLRGAHENTRHSRYRNHITNSRQPRYET